MAVIVTEPTVSGVHDLGRIFELSAKFSIPTACVINKADLNEEKTELIKKVIEENGIRLLGVIGYDSQFTQSMLTGKTIVESASQQSSHALRDIWSNIQQYAAQLQHKS
jgi:MinD superfamily P-loop ATPase